ncbi:MAG: hypothetical protein M3N28_11515 [Actinomycetota bacterium]|nr:hypothetical protein [Actinomycetota bacterium]
MVAVLTLAALLADDRCDTVLCEADEDADELRVDLVPAAAGAGGAVAGPGRPASTRQLASARAVPDTLRSSS